MKFLTMKFFHFISLLPLLTHVSAFAPSSGSLCSLQRMQQTSRHYNTLAMVSSSSSSSSSQETEAERLLRKARELRAAAELAEQQVHGDLTQKKTNQDAQTDDLIAQIRILDDDNTAAVVDILRNKRLGMATLERILLRLDARHVRAQGWEHVQGKVGNDGHTEFHRVAAPNEAEMKRLEGKVEQFIEAVRILDEEFRTQKKAKGEAYVAHAEETHWGGGKAADYLQGRIREIRRERSEHFQARMKELQDAQRRNKDHKFEGYNDLGTLN